MTERKRKGLQCKGICAHSGPHIPSSYGARAPVRPRAVDFETKVLVEVRPVMTCPPPSSVSFIFLISARCSALAAMGSGHRQQHRYRGLQVCSVQDEELHGLLPRGRGAAPLRPLRPVSSMSGSLDLLFPTRSFTARYGGYL